jgi:hypothetical protein
MGVIKGIIKKKALAKKKQPWKTSNRKLQGWQPILEKQRGKPFKNQKELENYIGYDPDWGGIKKRRKKLKPLQEKMGLKNFLNALSDPTTDQGKAMKKMFDVDLPDRPRTGAKKKRKGGKITYRMTGGQVVASSYDK